MDTTFIIDASVCDKSENWNRVLNFVQTLVTYFDVSKPVGRIALIPFSTDAKVVLKLNSLSGELLNGKEVNKRVSALQCQGGSRRIDKALELAAKEVVTTENGLRAGVSRVLYLFLMFHNIFHTNCLCDTIYGFHFTVVSFIVKETPFCVVLILKILITAGSFLS